MTRLRFLCALCVWAVVSSVCAGGHIGAQEFPASHPVSMYREAVRARADGDFYRAIELLRNVLAKNPAYFDAVFSLAEIFFRLEEYDQALAMTNRALELEPASVPAAVLRGRVKIGLGKGAEAGGEFAAILKREPNNLEARLAAAELDVAGGRNLRAMEAYREILRTSQDNRQALLSLALIHEAMGNRTAAGDYFDLALRHHGENPIVQLYAGEFRLAAGDYAASENFARTALGLKAGYKDALMLLGRSRFLRGDYGGAYSLMDDILKLDTNNASAWYLKAACALSRGAPREAITLLRTLLALGQENEIARLTLEEILREFLPVEDPLRREFAEYHFLRGLRFQERNLFSRAYEEYRRGLQINPYSKEGRVSFADVIEKLGFYARAYGVLEFLKAQNMADNSVLESLEMGSGVMENRVSREWDVDQLLVKRRKFSLSLFLDSGRSNLAQPNSGIYLVRYAADLLAGTPHLEAAPSPFEVKNFGEAFQEARQRGSDYFLLVSFSETEGEFILRAELYLSRTGGKIDSFQVYRTGNEKAVGCLSRFAADLSAKFPVRGELLRRDFERGLVNLGLVDGVKAGDSFLVISKAALGLKFDSLEFSWRPEDVLGTLTVTKIDDMLSEGVLEKKGFYDRINPGDAIFKNIEEKAPKEESPPARGVNEPLYRKILNIR